MHCQACGFEIASGTKFCGECGAPRAVPSTPLLIVDNTKPSNGQSGA
jgi:hypothetical protein